MKRGYAVFITFCIYTSETLKGVCQRPRPYMGIVQRHVSWWMPVGKQSTTAYLA
jgi:hypothetical protein